jgi:ubiquinone/menaquinone biosynthesis C-methylase UbiE
MVGARALSTAFEIGLIDCLVTHQPCGHEALLRAMQTKAPLDSRGLELILVMLHANGVVEALNGRYSVTAGFAAALVFRDLLEAKLYFAHLVAPDFSNLFTALLLEPHKFIEQARLFKLFSYDRCFEPSADNYAHTARWMRLTTALTKYEAQACVSVHDFSNYRAMLDVGGNSGEFVLRVCKACPELRATVYDLPLVCDIGRDHISREPEAARINFIKVDPHQNDFPAGYDLISFKSMLHDWPDAEMDGFLARAHAALDPGGKVLIFERGQIPQGLDRVAYGQLPLMLFFRSYRSPLRYQQKLVALGFHSILVDQVILDMPFLLITATK